VRLTEDAIETLGARLARLSTTLLVLDNFERLVDSASSVVSSWLERAPELKIVITSRERLRLREEHVVELTSLSLEDDAVQLFVERARAHQPDFALADADHDKLTAVLAALEGNPLAIELAAARIDALGLDELQRRMSAQLQLLSRGARGADRQATLYAAIDASWQLLDEAQRRALGRLAVFRGGFTLEAAESVIGPDALDRIQDLRDRSLLRSPQGGRFTLYESIREFALEQVTAVGDHAAAVVAHRTYFLAVGDQHARAFTRNGAAIDELAFDRDNLLAVFERALAARDLPAATKAVLNLVPILATRGPAQFHLELLERIFAEVDDEPELLHARGLARRAVGDLEGAEKDLLAGLLIAPEGWLHACMRKDLGVLHHQRRRIEQARACYASALLQARALEDRRLDGIITGNLGALEHDIGRFEEAARLYREALDRLREVADARLEGIFWTNFGVLEQEEGRASRARKHYERARVLLSQTADSRFEAIALGNLGLLEHEAGDHATAKERHEQALALLLEVGDTRSEAWCRASLGAVLAELGDLTGSEAQLDEAERLVVGRDPLGLALVRLHRCFLEVAAQDTEAAFARIEEAQARRDDEPSLAEVNDDARMLLRMLAKSMTRGPGPRLEVGEDAKWFRPPGGAKQSLEKYAAARHILERLTVARLSGGEALSADELFAAGWPGVKIAPRSANNRLYVALAKLRKMGLKVLLLRTEQGYELDPHTPVLRGGV
jgi:predicted ATPase